MKARLGKPLFNLDTGVITHTVQVFARGGWHYLGEDGQVWNGTADQAEAKVAELRATPPKEGEA